MRAATLAAPLPEWGWPRLLSRELAANYFSCSTDQIDRLIAVGAITPVRLPASRHRNGAVVMAPSHRVLIDRIQLDALADKSRQ